MDTAMNFITAVRHRICQYDTSDILAATHKLGDETLDRLLMGGLTGMEDEELISIAYELDNYRAS